MRMKKVLFVVLVALALAAPAMAQDNGSNAASGVGVQAACGSGGCFEPSFTFLGETVKYAGTGTAGNNWVMAGDCCLAGDKYLFSLSSGGLKGSSQTTTVVIPATCTTSWSSPSYAAIVAASTAKAQMKIQKAGGGLPASAVIRMALGAWHQTAGSDSCGF
jgi:hypothetical protein